MCLTIAVKARLEGASAAAAGEYLRRKLCSPSHDSACRREQGVVQAGYKLSDAVSCGERVVWDADRKCKWIGERGASESASKRVPKLRVSADPTAWLTFVDQTLRLTDALTCTDTPASSHRSLAFGLVSPRPQILERRAEQRTAVYSAAGQVFRAVV